MKNYNKTHEATIVSSLNLKNTVGLNDGDIVPHDAIVNGVYFYYSQHVNGSELFVKVNLSRDFILDIANQIKEIEAEKVNSTYNYLPF